MIGSVSLTYHTVKFLTRQIKTWSWVLTHGKNCNNVTS